MPVASILLQELERCKLRSGQAFGTRHPESTLLHLAHYRTTKDPPQGLDEPWTPGLILGTTEAHGSVHNTGSSREPTPATEAAGPAVDRTQHGDPWTLGQDGRHEAQPQSTVRVPWAEPEATPAAIRTPQPPWRDEAPRDGPRQAHSRAGLTLSRPEQLQLRVHSLQLPNACSEVSCGVSKSILTFRLTSH